MTAKLSFSGFIKGFLAMIDRYELEWLNSQPDLLLIIKHLSKKRLELQ